MDIVIIHTNTVREVRSTACFIGKAILYLLGTGINTHRRQLIYNIAPNQRFHTFTGVDFHFTETAGHIRTRQACIHCINTLANDIIFTRLLNTAGYIC